MSSITKSCQVLGKAADALQHLDFETPYFLLKNSLLGRLMDRRDEFPHTFLYQCHREKATITEYLARQRTLLGLHYDPGNDIFNDLLRHRILDALYSQTRLAVY